MLEDVNYINNNYYYNRPQQNQGWNQHRPNYSERRSRTPRHSDLHRHGGLPRSTLQLWVQRQHYTQACRSDTLSFPKEILKNLCVRVGTLYAPVLPRLVSTPRRGRRHFPSRTRLQSQNNPDMNQRIGPTGGTGTSKCGPSQLRWSLQFNEVEIVDLSHRF